MMDYSFWKTEKKSKINELLSEKWINLIKVLTCFTIPILRETTCVLMLRRERFSQKLRDLSGYQLQDRSVSKCTRFS